ncbi:MAG: hybrid sensor histidine kinase/response regulator [Fibrobacter sp.]|nr:hybrid sensor histidine kinase/response regulator [Fibrobacter sp.]
MDKIGLPHVLLIDDELSICTGVTGLLELDGFKADYALSAEEGLQYIEKNPEVDIVLLDVNLGQGLSGMDVLPLIKERSRYVQVVMFTSHDRLDIGLICMKRGALDFITKPFDLKTFFRIAATALDKKKLEQVKDLYIDMVIHDLKNPLQCISGALEILIDTIPEKSTIQQKLIDTAGNGIQRIQMMIGNILAVTTFEKGSVSARREYFPLREQVENALQFFSPVVITINENVPEKIYTDRDLFLRVLTNIVANASRFATPETNIDVKFEYNGNGTLISSVTNQGSFIPEEYRNAVFDKYVGMNKTANVIRGHNFGLGLTFSKMAIEALGGKIWIEGDEQIPETSFKFSVSCIDASH